jgi:GxxExxY protein
MELTDLTGQVIGSAIKIHNELGPGLLESTYKACLFHRLTTSGLMVVREKPVPLIFDEIKLECGYRLDLLVENKLVLEVKSVDALNDIHMAQTLTYMKLGDYKLGLLINFNVLRLKDGIRRLINGTI